MIAARLRVGGGKLTRRVIVRLERLRLVERREGRHAWGVDESRARKAVGGGGAKEGLKHGGSGRG